MTGHRWTTELDEKAAALWRDGHSAADVARRMGLGFTRSAIIGRMHRLKVKGGSGKDRPAEAKPKRRVRTLKKVPALRLVHPARAPDGPVPAPPGEPSSVDPIEQPPFKALGGEPPSDTAAAVMGLTWGACRFPLGHPGRPGFRFCGAARHGKWPYCQEHGAVTYQPSKKRVEPVQQVRAKVSRFQIRAM